MPPTWLRKPFKAENVKAMSRVRRAGCAPADFEDGGVTREQAPGSLSEQSPWPHSMESRPQTPNFEELNSDPHLLGQHLEFDLVRP